MQGRETFPITEGLPNLDRTVTAENGRKVLETRRRRSNRGELTLPPAETEGKKSLPVLRGDRLFDAQELPLEDFELNHSESSSFDEPLLTSEQEEQFRQIQPGPDFEFKRPVSFEAEIVTPERVQIEHTEPGYRTVKQTRRRRGFLRFHKNSEGLGLEIGAEEETDEEHIIPHHHNPNPVPGPDRRRYFTDRYQDATPANRPEGGHYFARNNGRGVLRDQPYSTLPEEQPRRGVLREPFTNIAPPEQPKARGVIREPSASGPEGGHYFARNNGRGVLRDQPYSTLPEEQPRRGVLRESTLNPVSDQEQQLRRRGALREPSTGYTPVQPERRSILRPERRGRNTEEDYDLRYDPNARPDIGDYDDIGGF